MRAQLLLVIVGAALLASFAADGEPPTAVTAPAYTADGKLRLPEDYRLWVYLATGFDMSYNPALRMGHHMFDNVFVNPDAYLSFLQTGTWPDRPCSSSPLRRGDRGSINKAGQYQSTLMGLEMHVKDEARFPGKWAFFVFDEGKPATMIPQSADCYSCHTDHAAVDTTFVQFYPTLLPIATARGTLSAAYQRESAPAKNPMRR
jgi:hypothetical protein